MKNLGLFYVLSLGVKVFIRTNPKKEEEQVSDPYIGPNKFSRELSLNILDQK